MKFTNRLKSAFKMIFNKYDANYLKVQDFIDDNNIDECMPLSLNCADCTWVKTMFINKDKEVCVSVMECEIYEEDEVVLYPLSIEKIKEIDEPILNLR